MKFRLGAIQVVANVSPLFPVTVPEFFAKTDLDRFPSRFLSGERETHSGSVIMRNRALGSRMKFSAPARTCAV